MPLRVGSGIHYFAGQEPPGYCQCIAFWPGGGGGGGGGGMLVRQVLRNLQVRQLHMSLGVLVRGPSRRGSSPCNSKLFPFLCSETPAKEG